MAQSRAARLAPVVDMAEKAEKTAAQRLGYFQGQVRLAESKLADLDGFRLEYLERWVERGKEGVSGQWLLGYQGFLGQLGTAIDQQRQSLAWHQNNSSAPCFCKASRALVKAAWAVCSAGNS